MKSRTSLTVAHDLKDIFVLYSPYIDNSCVFYFFKR